MTKEDYKKEEHALRRQLLDMRFEHKGGRLQNTALLQTTRRNLARLLTLMRQNHGKA